MLRLSTKGRYATRILVYLATVQNGPISKNEIAAAEEISEDYVEQIMVRLKTAGLVVSRRGAKGGFSLAREASAITVADVIESTEGPVLLVPCLEKDDCSRLSICVTQPIWKKATEALRNIFASVTIAELATQARQLRDSRSISFDI